MTDSGHVIDILISTCNRRLAGVLEVFLPPDHRVRYIVVHQVFDSNLSDDDFSEVDDLIRSRSDVKLYRVNCKGLSLSRNIALSKSTAPFILFADDDIHYLENSVSTILKAFSEIPDADIITFRFKDKSGGYSKKYPSTIKRRTSFNLFSVSSVEVALRKEAFWGNKITFDEQFGLGAGFPVSEENVFLTDMSRIGKKIYFYPEDILIHPEETSGGNWGESHLIARGALFKRVFGWLGLPLLLLFLCKHGKKISSQGHLYAGVKVALRSFCIFKS